MTGWLTFWTLLLLLTLMAFSVLVVVVAIGGFRDIREMFRRLSKSETSIVKSGNPLDSSNDDADRL